MLAKVVSKRFKTANPHNIRELRSYMNKRMLEHQTGNNRRFSSRNSVGAWKTTSQIIFHKTIL